MDKITKSYQKNDRKYVNILGINVVSSQLSEVLTNVDENISHNIKTSILTPNPELILASKTNKKLRDALNNATFAVPDGVGLKLADPNLQIIKGRVLFNELIKIAVVRGWKVFLLGGLDNEAELAARKLQSTDHKLQIETAGGVKVSSNSYKDAVDKINKFKPQLLFVALGNPKQEIWIDNFAGRVNATCVMAVGGTFRYIAGMSKLPPIWVADLGFEWLWRLLTEPYRFKRIWNAVVLFPVELLKYKLSKAALAR